MNRPIAKDDSAIATVAPPAPPAGKVLSYEEKLKKRRAEMAAEKAKLQAAMNDPHAAVRRAAGLPPLQPPVSVYRFQQGPDPSVVLDRNGVSVCPPGYRQANVPYTDTMQGEPGPGNINHFKGMGYEVLKDEDGGEVHDALGNVVMICPDEKLIDYMSAANPNMVDKDEFFRQKAYLTLPDLIAQNQGQVTMRDPVDSTRDQWRGEDASKFE